MTPTQLCKSTKEDGTQRALFAWANMAMSFGFEAAEQDKSYTVPGHAQKLLELHNDAEQRLKWLYHIKNEEKGGVIRGANAKALGIKSGVSDICLPVRVLHKNYSWASPFYGGLYIELKRETGGKESKAQTEFGEFVTNQGYKYQCIIGWRLASLCIREYLRS